MSVTGPILLVEDDLYDSDMIINGLKDLGIKNEIHCFTTTKDVLDYLLSTKQQPFIILCDIMLPEKNGLDFRSSIIKNPFLKKKAIPFIFYTAFSNQQIIEEAYDLDVQGFFKKPDHYETLKNELSCICDYWSKCLHPNS